MNNQNNCGHVITASSRKQSWFRRRSYVSSLALVVCLAASCSTQTTSDSADSALEPTTTTADEELRDVVMKRFQTKLYYYPNGRPNLKEMGDVLRRNEVFGGLFIVPEEFSLSNVETKICEDFAIADLLSGTKVGAKRKVEVAQDLTKVEGAKWPDVTYVFTLIMSIDVDTTSIKNNVARLSDIFYLSPDKRCTGTLATGPELKRSQSFTTGNFPEIPGNGFETYNYVQFGDGSDRFARSVSLMILEPAQSAISIVVTAFNVRTRAGSKVTSDDMLFEVSNIAKELKTLWMNKIQTDPDWLALNY